MKDVHIQHLIDGTQVAGTQWFETVNPATQEVLAQVARGGPAEIDAAVAAAKAAFPKWRPGPRRNGRSCCANSAI
jgi:5-carboxymethyl-2-hydroxymuconic-semialdehyde dehydrogenase